MTIKRYELGNNDLLFALAMWGVSFFVPVLGPLGILLIKGGESVFVEDTIRMYFNIMITAFIYTVISGILVLVGIGIILLIVVGVWTLVVTIIGIVASIQGEVRSLPGVIDIFGALK